VNTAQKLLYGWIGGGVPFRMPRPQPYARGARPKYTVSREVDRRLRQQARDDANQRARAERLQGIGIYPMWERVSRRRRGIGERGVA